MFNHWEWLNRIRLISVKMEHLFMASSAGTIWTWFRPNLKKMDLDLKSQLKTKKWKSFSQKIEMNRVYSQEMQHLGPLTKWWWDGSISALNKPTFSYLELSTPPTTISMCLTTDILQKMRCISLLLKSTKAENHILIFPYLSLFLYIFLKTNDL